MYCPICFNDTLKLASSGVVKMTFNGKSKPTSQFFYNLAQDRDEDILKKLKEAIKDYFEYYSNFQNKDIIEHIECYSIDFKCENRCVININNKVNVIGLIFSFNELSEIANEVAKKYQLDIKLIN